MDWPIHRPPNRRRALNTQKNNACALRLLASVGVCHGADACCRACDCGRLRCCPIGWVELRDWRRAALGRFWHHASLFQHVAAGGQGPLAKGDTSQARLCRFHDHRRDPCTSWTDARNCAAASLEKSG